DVAKHTREEARVYEVQDCVLDTSALEIDRTPVRDLLRIERQVGVLRVAEPEEIPGRVAKRVPRGRLAPRGAAAFGTRSVHEFRDLRQRGVAPSAERRQTRELD